MSVFRHLDSGLPYRCKLRIIIQVQLKEHIMI